MSKKAKVTTKTSEAKKDNSISRGQKTDLSQSKATAADQILHLQSTIGNQAVQRLFESGTIQAKLKIGTPNDKYEKEADRVADQVMRMPEPKISRQPVEEEEEELIQPKPIAAQITPLVQRQVEPEEEEEEEPIQAKGDNSSTAVTTPGLESSINSLRGGGQPLPESIREYFEPRFGSSFSQVKVHNNLQAANIAKSINAKAFTKGNDVIFNSGQYSPETSSGKRLLAHELTHVVQQTPFRAYKVMPNVLSIYHGRDASVVYRDRRRSQRSRKRVVKKKWKKLSPKSIKTILMVKDARLAKTWFEAASGQVDSLQEAIEEMAKQGDITKQAKKKFKEAGRKYNKAKVIKGIVNILGAAGNLAFGMKGVLDLISSISKLKKSMDTIEKLSKVVTRTSTPIYLTKGTADIALMSTGGDETKMLFNVLGEALIKIAKSQEVINVIFTKGIMKNAITFAKVAAIHLKSLKDGMEAILSEHEYIDRKTGKVISTHVKKANLHARKYIAKLSYFRGIFDAYRKMGGEIAKGKPHRMVIDRIRSWLKSGKLRDYHVRIYEAKKVKHLHFTGEIINYAHAYRMTELEKRENYVTYNYDFIKDLPVPKAPRKPRNNPKLSPTLAAAINDPLNQVVRVVDDAYLWILRSYGTPNARYKGMTDKYTVCMDYMGGSGRCIMREKLGKWYNNWEKTKEFREFYRNVLVRSGRYLSVYSMNSKKTYPIF